MKWRINKDGLFVFFGQVLTSNQNLIVIDWGGNKKTFLALPQASEKEKSKREK